MIFLIKIKKENSTKIIDYADVMLDENSNMIDDLSEDIENTDFDDYDVRR